MPARMAAATAASLSPSMTISITQPMRSSSSLRLASPRSVGQKASLVDAISAGYRLPTFEPERTTPPGNGRITSGSRRIAVTAASAAASAASVSRARNSRLPPPTPLTTGVVSCATNSPSITGTRQ